LVLREQAGDPLLDRRLFPDQRAQMENAATAEEDRDDECQRDATGRDDREALPQHPAAHRRLTHRAGRYTRQRPEHKHDTRRGVL